MWLVTTQGFYSAVAHRTSDEHVLVRARTREDIEALRRQIPEIEPFEDLDADYRHRAVVTRAEWVSAVAQFASEIDYGNFKSAVAVEQGHERAAVYSRLWGDLRTLQTDEER